MLSTELKTAEPTADDLPQRIAAALAKGYSGDAARIRMSPELSYGRHAGPAPPTARAAAVILLLYQRDGRWYLPLTERAATLARHGGQISLPGGAVDPGETSAEAALRELREELGIEAAVEILGRLADCYVFASDFFVTPWLATTIIEPRWKPHDREVQGVIELPLEVILDDATVGRMTVQRGPLEFNAPYMRFNETCIWGATSVILSELGEVLRHVGRVRAPAANEETRSFTLAGASTRPTAVVFDLDGLLINSEDLYEQAGESILRRRGKIYDAELREKMMGRPVADAIQLMIDCHSLPDPLDDLMCECREVLESFMETSLATMPGVEQLLDELQAADIPIAIATSGMREYAHYVLTRLNLLDRFRFVLTAEDIERGKPDPEVYLLAAKRLGIDPSQMMVLEDSGNGCQAAVAAGAFTIAVPNRHTQNHTFPAVQFVANTLADPRIHQSLR